MKTILAFIITISIIALISSAQSQTIMCFKPTPSGWFNNPACSGGGSGPPPVACGSGVIDFSTGCTLGVLP